MIFGRTQQSVQTPFQPGRTSTFFPTGSPFTSIEAQSAIEEALSRAVANDRFLILSNYNGNANAGRYLEFFPARASSDAPIELPITSLVFTVVAAAEANATGTIGFYDLNGGSPVLLYTVTFTAQKLVSLSGTPLFSIPANARLAIKVDSGSFNKPYLYFTLSNSG